MQDLLVRLYSLPEAQPVLDALKAQGIEIRRAMPANKSLIVEWVGKNFGFWWQSETDVAFSNKPVSCFLAVTDGGEIIGFACYEATCKDFFGPTGVLESMRGKGIGTGLLLKCLEAMHHEGYAYAIIGGVDEAIPFYQKVLDAQIIKGSEPGIYKDLLMG
jgi:GNAT superfamily N-acetyltransferase